MKATVPLHLCLEGVSGVENVEMSRSSSRLSGQIGTVGNGHPNK